MKIKAIFSVIGQFTKKNSPYILSGFGAAAVTAGTIVIVKKAKKQNDFDEKVLDEYEEKRYLIENEQDEKAQKRAIVKLNINKAAKYVGYYAPPVVLISGGVLCMFSAMMIQTKRLKTMSAAYTALAAAFNEYRDRVKAVVGEEKEDDIFKGIVRDDKGNVVSEDPIDKKYLENTTEFSRLFGDGNTPYWSKDPRICLAAINGAQTTCNAILREKGFITLNEVYHELGFRPSEEGMYLGWRFKYGDKEFGSTYVDFGYSGPKNERKCEDIRADWNREMWINLIPPHTLFGKVPKEVVRTEAEKEEIIKRRRQIG